MSQPNSFGRARAEAGFSQDDVAAFMGASRTTVSYWESGTRVPSDSQTVALARLYGSTVSALWEMTPPANESFADMMLRNEGEVSPTARRGLTEFQTFLDNYAHLAEALSFDVRGMTQSPFATSPHFESADDIRRKAEEVRSFVGLGMGPIGDVDTVCDLLGITVLRTSLGSDLRETISGAFYRHDTLGFAILVNLDMTPGRRRFTVAHEIAHALFHSKARYSVSGPVRDAKEKFADAFAGEFLMPVEGIRRVLEEHDIGPRITDPVDVIHLQRSFGVSYATALVRLRNARLVNAKQYAEFKHVRPVVLAQQLGYEPDHEEFLQDPQRWRIRRFPGRFLRLARIAIERDALSVPSAANMLGVTTDEVAEFLLAPVSPDAETPKSITNEFDEYEASGILADA